jgi:hypothetical protein
VPCCFGDVKYDAPSLPITPFCLNQERFKARGRDPSPRSDFHHRPLAPCGLQLHGNLPIASYAPSKGGERRHMDGGVRFDLLEESRARFLDVRGVLAVQQFQRAMSRALDEPLEG